MSITLRDVARRAGVSVKTVSRVVNNQGEISNETRQRIKNVIREMGYRPNMIARGLVTQRTRTIGLVVPDITNPFFPELARGVQDAGRQEDYNIFLCNTDENQQQEQLALHSLIAQGVDGIIISPCYQTDENLARLAENFAPIVTINHWFEHPNISNVRTDNYRGAQLAVEHLIARGHCNIGMIAGRERSPLRGRRLAGFCETMLSHQLPVCVEPIEATNPNIASGLATAHLLLSKFPEVTALFAYNDLIALGAIQACRQLGKRVPEDCAIVGFDDIQVAALANPPLTTVRLEKQQIGKVAVSRLLEMIGAANVSLAPIQLGVELMIRQST